VPLAYPPMVFTRNRRPHYLGVVARQRPGISLSRAQQEMDTIARGLERQYPDTNTQMGVRLESFHSSLAFEPRPALLMLSGAAPSTRNRLPVTPSDFRPCGSPKPVRKTSLAPLPLLLNCS